MIQNILSLKYEPASEPLHIGEGCTLKTGRSVESLSFSRPKSASAAVHRSSSTPSAVGTCGVCSQFEHNYFTEMCSGSEAGSYVRLIDFVHHSTLVLREIQRREEENAAVHRFSSTPSAVGTCRVQAGEPKRSRAVTEKTWEVKMVHDSRVLL